MAVPRRGALLPRWVVIPGGVVCLVLMIAYGIHWQDNGWRDGEAGLWIAGILLVWGLVWALVACMRFASLSGTLTPFRRACSRSMLPLFAIVLILAGLTIHLGLGWAEKRHVTFLQQPGYRLFTDELEMSAFKALRDEMAAEHDRLMQERYGK